ncbi:MAG: hypothetical protein QNI89_10440 [Desulfobacterales bacterium]|nr:hypothetical protein [Desulfobacterales bacterium]
MAPTRRNPVVMIAIFIIYEGVILFLLMAAIIPKGLSFFEFWEDPFLYIQAVDQYAIALTLALFLPLVYRKIDVLKFGSAEVKLRSDVEEVKDGVKEVDINDRLSGIYNKDFDVGVIYDTDPEMTDGRYRKIKWEGSAFPPIHQYAMPLCRREHADTLQAALDDLEISTQDMIDLKSRAKRAKYDDMALEGIARKFLK